MKCLIKPHGYLGDHIFAAPIAKKLKEENQYDVVDIAAGMRSVGELLENDPYIDSIIYSPSPTPFPFHNIILGGYDAEFQLSEVTKLFPPPVQFQMECGVKSPSPEFELYLRKDVEERIVELLPSSFVAVMHRESWKNKAYKFTYEEYLRGIDVPNKGYGGELRNIDQIIRQLQNAGITMVEVGAGPGINSLNNTLDSILWTAAVIKKADYFIGTEGGLSNIAAGVHTKTILTGDFVHQLYGFNGVIKKVVDPKLGPKFYWPLDGHIELNPYLSDIEVADEIIAVVTNKKTANDYTYEWRFPT